MAGEYVIVGHVSLDRKSGGAARLGGTVAYAARAARLLGLGVRVLTSAPVDVSSLPEFYRCETITLPAAEWTVFENRQTETGRRQYWHSTASEIDLTDVPARWKTAAIFHLAPIAQEIPPALALECQAGLCCATIQGWLRGRGSKANVLLEINKDLMAVVKHLDAAVLSEEDVQGDQLLISDFAEATDILVVTRGGAGCDVYVNGRRSKVSTVSMDLVDSTGAGDVFSAAFFSALSAGRDPLKSAHYANGFARWFLEDRSRLDESPQEAAPPPLESGQV